MSISKRALGFWLVVAILVPILVLLLSRTQPVSIKLVSPAEGSSEARQPEVPGFESRALSDKPAAATPDTRLSQSIQAVLPGAAEDTRIIRAGAPPMASLLRVELINSLTLTPIEGATIEISARGGGGQSSVPADGQTRTSDREGRATFRLEPDRYSLRASRAGYHSLELNLDLYGPADSSHKRLPMDPDYTVHGIVRNQEGVPVNPACLIFTPGDGAEPLHVDADKEGRFSAGLTDRSYDLEARSAFGVRYVSDISAAEYQNRLLEINLVEHRSPDQVVVTGRVRDSEGYPLEKARLLLWTGEDTRESKRLIDVAETDENGDYQLITERLPEARLTVQAKGYEEQRRNLELQRDAQADFSLNPYSRFRVEVFDPLGARISGADVRGVALSADSGGQAVFSTEVEGEYYATEYPFMIYASGLSQGLGFTPVEVISEHRPLIQLNFSSGGELQVRVFDDRGRPVPEYVMRLDGPHPYRALTSAHSERGLLRLRYLPEGRYKIWVGAEEFLPGEGWVTISGNSRLVEKSLIMRPPEDVE